MKKFYYPSWAFILLFSRLTFRFSLSRGTQTCDISVTTPEIFKLIKRRDFTKALSPDRISVILIIKHNHELSLVLSKLFKHCLQERYFQSLWKVLTVCPVYKLTLISVELSPQQSAQSSQQNFCGQQDCQSPQKNNLQNDKQYGLRISRYTADVLTVTVRRTNEVLDNKSIMRVIADVISGRGFSIIKSFLSCKSMKAVVSAVIASQ